MYENEDRLRRIENRLQLLTWMVGAQLGISTLVALAYLTSSVMASATKFLLFLVIVGVIAVIFRRKIPRASRVAGRWLSRLINWVITRKDSPSVS